MRLLNRNRCSGFNLIESVITMAILFIPLLAVGILLSGGSRGWHQTYNSVQAPVKQDSLVLTVTFCSIGRRSNRTNYEVYTMSGGNFTEAIPVAGQNIAKGQAVEFRYWKNPFEPSKFNSNSMAVTNTGTHYALFYLDNDELKVDYGKVVNGVGGVSPGGMRITSDVQTIVLARNVDITDNDIFSHFIIGGVGNGAVRMHLSLQDDDGETVEVKTATFLRITWPQ